MLELIVAIALSLSSRNVTVYGPQPTKSNEMKTRGTILDKSLHNIEPIAADGLTVSLDAAAVEYSDRFVLKAFVEKPSIFNSFYCHIYKKDKLRYFSTT
jgi:hypothetical protein